MLNAEQFGHICRAAASVAGVQKLYAFATRATKLYPLPLDDLSRLLRAFGAEYPEEAGQLAANVAIWQERSRANG